MLLFHLAASATDFHSYVTVLFVFIRVLCFLDFLAITQMPQNSERPENNNLALFKSGFDFLVAIAGYSDVHIFTNGFAILNNKDIGLLIFAFVFFIRILVVKHGLYRHRQGFFGGLSVDISTHAHTGADYHTVLFIQQNFHQE